jgi:hypothetical protein
VGWLAAIVFAGGVTQAFAEHRQPVVETTLRDVHVLPAGQTEVTGTITGLRGTGVNGPWLPLGSLDLQGGTATIEGATVDGRRSTIVWDGGRPFLMKSDDGWLDAGPSDVSADHGRMRWPIDGPDVLRPGRYEIRTPVAVGTGGLAQPRDEVTFFAVDGTTIETTGAMTTTTPAEGLHLTGPGTLVLDGSFEVQTRDGYRMATHLEFGPGPFELDIGPELTLKATLQGPLR